MKTRYGMLAGLPVAAVMLFGAGGAVAAQDGAGTAQKPQRRLTVTGQGEIKATPDMAEVSIGVLTEDKTSKAASRKNAESSQAVQQAVKRLGVPEKDIQTINYSVQPVYNQPAPNQRDFRPQIVGYRVSNTVRVTVRQLDKLGDVLDAATGAGSNTIDGVVFDIAEREALEQRALQQAVQKAWRKANVIATATGGSIRGIYDINAASFPRPMAFEGRAMMRADAEVATPIAPGEMTITASVTIVYELADILNTPGK